MNKEQSLNEPQSQQLNIAGVIQRLFHFQIYIANIWLNRYAWIGFQILTIDNCKIERSLLSIAYHPFDKRLFINLCFFNWQRFF